MVSLAAGTLSQVATLRSATRALASYQRTDGSLAVPCLAAFFVSLPAHIIFRASPLIMSSPSNDVTHPIGYQLNTGLGDVIWAYGCR